MYMYVLGLLIKTCIYMIQMYQGEDFFKIEWPHIQAIYETFTHLMVYKIIFHTYQSL